MATISSPFADCVTLHVRSVDRLFLQGYVPRLQTQGQVIRFLLDRAFPIPSSTLLGKIGRGYVEPVNHAVRGRRRTKPSCGTAVQIQIARRQSATGGCARAWVALVWPRAELAGAVNGVGWFAPAMGSPASADGALALAAVPLWDAGRQPER